MTSSSGGIDWVEWTPTFDGSKTSKPVVVRTIARPPLPPPPPMDPLLAIAVVVTGMSAYSEATSFYNRKLCFLCFLFLCCSPSASEHNRIRSRCKSCGGSSICEHNRRRSSCKSCGGSAICEHNRRGLGHRSVAHLAPTPSLLLIGAHSIDPDIKRHRG